ncbi:hypothetical protein HHJ39_00015 [Escherichia coli]|nr:hypothetical protein HHJ39_00015 [Escherichia coli]
MFDSILNRDIFLPAGWTLAARSVSTVDKENENQQPAATNIGIAWNCIDLTRTDFTAIKTV